MRRARIALYFVLGVVAVLAICLVVTLNLDLGHDVNASIESR